MKKFIYALAVLALTSVTAHAGDRVMSKSNGMKVSIHCTGGGCVTKHYRKSGKVIRTSRGPGCSHNFRKVVRRMSRKGYH